MELVIKAGAYTPTCAGPASGGLRQRLAIAACAHPCNVARASRLETELAAILELRGARMSSAFATHEVFNQSPPFEDVNLFTTDRALMEAVDREGGGHAAKRLTAFGAVCGSADAFERGRLANENPPRLKTFDSKGRRLDMVEFHPAYHECMDDQRRARGCTARPGSIWPRPAPSPLPGANVARSAGCYMAIQMEAGHQCPITMTNAAVPTLLLQPEIAPDVAAEDPVARLRQELQAGGGQARRHHRHGHDGEAGRHRRARQHHDGRAGRRRRAGRGVHRHRAQVVHVGADVRRLPGAGAGAGRAVLLPDAALPARRHASTRCASSASRTSSATAPMPPRRWSSRRARLADRRGGPRRAGHHRDGDGHAARLRRRLGRPDAAGARQRHPPLPAPHRVPEASSSISR